MKTQEATTDTVKNEKQLSDKGIIELAKTTDDEELLDEIIARDEEEELEAIAGNPNAPAEVLRDLAENTPNTEQGVLAALEQNPSTPQDILEAFEEPDGFILDEEGKNRYGIEGNGLFLGGGSIRASDESPSFRDAEGYDENGYNKFGNDRDGNDGTYKPVSELIYGEDGKRKGSGHFDKNGYDFEGFDAEGIHATTGDTYNERGLDREGYNRSGWPDYIDRNDDAGVVVSSNRLTGTAYAPDGYDIFGFDKKGIHRSGTRFDAKGRDRYGFDEDGWSGGNPIHKATRTEYAPDGYDHRGFDRDGYGRDGFNRKDRDRQGFDRDGRDKEGFDRKGLNQRGFSRDGRNATTGTFFDEKGFSADGYDKDGFDRNGRDDYGLTRGQEIHRDRIPSTFYSDSEKTQEGKIVQRSFDQQDWVRRESSGYSPEERAYAPAGSLFISRKTGTEYGTDGFNIFGVNADGISKSGFNLNTKLHEETGTEIGPDGWNYNRSAWVPGALDRD